jgi:hypothetical protein
LSLPKENSVWKLTTTTTKLTSYTVKWLDFVSVQCNTILSKNSFHILNQRILNQRRCRQMYYKINTRYVALYKHSEMNTNILVT